MIDFKISEVPIEFWESEYSGVTQVRTDNHSNELTKIAIETPEGLQFVAVHAGRIIIGTCAHMHWVYKQHLPGLLDGDPQTISRYLRPLPPKEPGIDRIWFNNRSYLRENGY